MKTKIPTSSKLFTFRLINLVKHPMFGILTVVGNGTIAGAAYLFYVIEHPFNPIVKSYLDALWWAVTTCTTVGYGDVIPSSVTGRVLGIVMMIFGTALFCSFTALFSSVLMGSKLEEVEEEVQELTTEVSKDETAINDLISKLETTLKDLSQLQKNKKRHSS